MHEAASTTSAAGAPVGAVDIIVIAVYTVAIVGLGCWVGVRVG